MIPARAARVAHERVRASTFGRKTALPVSRHNSGAMYRPDPADLPAAPRRADPRARLGLQVQRQVTAAGEIVLPPCDDHRLKLHAGDPVRGACSHHHFLYTRGDLDVLPAGSSDTWREESDNTILMVQVAPALLRRTAEEMGLPPERAGLTPRHQIRDPQIEYIAWALEADQQAGSPNGLLYTETLSTALAIHLLGHHGAANLAPRGLSQPQLRRLNDYIEAHLAEELTLARLAEVVHVSASHLKTLFKRSTGVPVHEYVVQRRVERARLLLTRGDMPIAQVALEAGFAHQSHMARCMRRVLGVTPTGVREARTRH